MHSAGPLPIRRPLLIAGALGSARTDPNGKAQTPALPAGRYYVVGFVTYKGHSLLWHLPVDVKAGANEVMLEPRNGSISHWRRSVAAASLRGSAIVPHCLDSRAPQR